MKVLSAFELYLYFYKYSRDKYLQFKSHSLIHCTKSTHFECIILSNNYKEEDVMCIPHGMTTSSSSGFVSEKKEKKHIQKPSKMMFEKGDPNFVDERIKRDAPKKKEGFFSSLFK